jgi:hypothetical protein
MQAKRMIALLGLAGVRTIIETRLDGRIALIQINHKSDSVHYPAERPLVADAQSATGRRLAGSVRIYPI